MSNNYNMLLFDFFNTLVLSDASKRPTMELAGKRVISTARLLRDVLAPQHPDLDTIQIHRAMEAARLDAQAKWGSEYREPPALERFRHVAKTLGIQEEDERTPQALLERHMQAVTGSFTFPATHGRLLKKLSHRYRLAIFSNFDHAPTLLGLLHAIGIEDIFDPIVVSERIGFRKPGRNAFRHALALAGEPVEHILFVGDSLKDDVEGARGVTLDVAWINSGSEIAPAECQPNYELRNLLELEALLGNT